MISILIFCHKKKEADILHKLCGYCTALMEKEALIFDVYGPLPELQMNEKSIERRSWDIIIFEVRSIKDISELRKIRKLFPEAALMIVAEPEIPPEKYVFPDFHPVMLLNKPFDRQKALEAVCQILRYCYRQREREAYTHSLIIRSGEERRYFRYTQILFLEAREKKIILYSDREELAFYDSLHRMEKILPEYFIRCHRSYIVNFMYISRLNISQGVLHICDKFVIPVSKKYKNNINNLLKDSK